MQQKKVIVLKEITAGFSAFSSPVSAICRIEREDGVSCFFLTPVNFRALENGEYYAVVLTENEHLFCFKLGFKPTYFFHNFVEEISGIEFASGIYSVECDIPVLIAYQRSENFTLSIKQFKSLANEKFLEIRKERLKKEKENAYNDFMIAEENYYIKEINDGYLSIKDEVACACGGEERQEKQPCDNTCQDEETKGSFSNQEKPNYYESVREELEKVLSRFDKEKDLCALFPYSEFVKVNYDMDKFYVVGVIKKDNAPKYICYGVPSPYNKYPPKELSGYCTFIPISVFNIHGDGYFMMFQDAVTGECVNFS